MKQHDMSTDINIDLILDLAEIKGWTRMEQCWEFISEYLFIHFGLLNK